ncbi:helix-turn-helix domain-containing protein [Kitasatospora sp. NPDC059673]|uniref:helix-turn-helix domain-containing protein n=1 Tax=Kitasatospora sp. NPDC059673 TaxID=3346901 RepID=UPI0036B73426
MCLQDPRWTPRAARAQHRHHDRHAPTSAPTARTGRPPARQARPPAARGRRRSAQGPRRRTPGLRRQEIARLAAASVEWYVRLERGRVGTPGPAVLHALADALRLTPDESRHLHLLARRESPHPHEANGFAPHCSNSWTDKRRCPPDQRRPTRPRLSAGRRILAVCRPPRPRRPSPPG